LNITSVFAIDVLVTKAKINFKAKIEINNLRVKKVKKVFKTCIPVTLEEISSNTYISKHYINAGAIICEKDIKIHKNIIVLFKFGNIEIEKEGRVVGETKKYIRVKKSDGRIEKIYKDGRLK
jgi:hypothetical protein